MHNAQAIDESIFELYDICQKHTDNLKCTQHFLNFNLKQKQNF